VEPIHRFQIDKANIQVYETRQIMGKAAGEAIANTIRKLLKQQNEVVMIFAAAPSQVEMLNTLTQQSDIDWNRIITFHLDEYVGLPQDAQQSFRTFLKQNIFGILQPKMVHYIQSDAKDPLEESLRYENLLRQNPIDIACIGIGENGHIAFNDPHVANINDPNLARVVQLAKESRQQQVNDGCFSVLEEVPREAITVTIPAILGSKMIFCVVPSSTKAKAVREGFLGAVSSQCPASMLRTHSNTAVFLDQDAAHMLLKDMGLPPSSL
jgi:glucosamine-6-phosphate deaminase